MPPGWNTASLLLLLGELATIVAVVTLLVWLSGRTVTALFSLQPLERFRVHAVAARRTLRGLLLKVGGLLILGVISIHLFWLYQGRDGVAETRALLDRLPTGTTGHLTKAGALIIALVFTVACALYLLQRAFAALSLWAQHFDGIQANDESVAAFFESTKRVVSRVAWLATLGVSASILGLPSSVIATVITLLKIYLIIAMGLIAWRAVDAIVVTVDGLSEKYASSRELDRYYKRLQSLVPLLRRTIEYLIYLTVATLALLQVEVAAPLAAWGRPLMRILSLFFLTRLVIEVAYLFAEEWLIRGKLTNAQQQRRATFVPLTRSVVRYGIYSVFTVVAMKELGIDPTPFLAGAGILGLAIGFGAQSLVSDVVSGLFILLEEYYLVGDFIEVGEAKGLVESIDMRTTRIRDAEGRHHILRNGEIGDVINYSKVFTLAVVEIGVAYDANLDHVARILEATGETAEKTRNDILETTRVEGVEVYAESSLILRTVTRVKPGCHRQVAMDLRKRFKEAFEENDIEIAPTISLECMSFPNH